MRIAVLIGTAQLLLHVVTNGNYGVFRDELYYLDCARQLAWGYVDHPPLSIGLLWLATSILGESVHAIRLLPELAGAVTVVVGALIARELGGGQTAQIVAAFTAAVVPGPAVLSGFFSMNAFDLVFWALLMWLLARIVRTDEPRLWLWFGVVAGIGLLNKISVLFLGAGVAVAILLTPLRRHLGCWQPYVGGVVALVLASPYGFWNLVNNWPTLEFMANAKQYKIAKMAPHEFIGEVALAMSPPMVLIWGAGLVWLLVPKWGGRFRALGFWFLAVTTLLIALKVKPYYLFPAFIVPLAAGGCAVEALLKRWNRRWISAIAFVWIGFSGLLTLPLAIPILSPDGMLAFQSKLGMGPGHYETNPVGAMPQYFSDRFGWPNMTRVVAGVYETLSAEEQERTLILGSNYGEIGAINYYGPALGLPRAGGGHNNHYLWGPPVDDPLVVIVLGSSRERLETAFESVEHAATVTATYAMPFENNLPVWVCRGLEVSMEEFWFAGKKFI